MTKSNLIHQATDQIQAMANVLHSTAQQNGDNLTSLVLALAPRLIELTFAISCAELNEGDGIDPVPDFHAVVYGKQTDAEGEQA
jgi:hypothetical protein